MKRFRFPLERVRRWRLEQFNIEQLKLQQAFAERKALADAKRQVQTDLANSRQEVLAQASVTGLELENLDSFRLHVGHRVREFENLERRAEEKVAAQRERMLEARQMFELLDQLREKALSAWQAEAGKEQETMAAELFLAKSIRNARRS